MRRVLKMLWAAPWSLLGLLIGLLGLLSGGHVQRKGRILEFWGGCVQAILRVCPFYSGSPVATFGHIVLGRSDRYLNACRKHQLVHVRQYEQWGLLFVPAYLTCSVAIWFSGKRPTTTTLSSAQHSTNRRDKEELDMDLLANNAASGLAGAAPGNTPYARS